MSTELISTLVVPAISGMAVGVCVFTCSYMVSKFRVAREKEKIINSLNVTQDKIILTEEKQKQKINHLKLTLSGLHTETSALMSGLTSHLKVKDRIIAYNDSTRAKNSGHVFFPVDGRDLHEEISVVTTSAERLFTTQAEVENILRNQLLLNRS